MINLTEPSTDILEINYIKKVLRNNNFTDGLFQNKAEKIISNLIKKKVYLTQSCSDALEVASIVIDLKKGDEVLLPSYTFSSTANAIVLRGAKPVFVDIDKNNLCIDLKDLERKITKKTKAIFVVHYAGNCCDMDLLLRIKKKNKLYLVEDAAHAFLSKYKNKYLGTFGDIGTYSFHETKNINGGQCGALVVNNPNFFSKIDIILDKGTDRKKYANIKNRFLIKTKKFYSWKGIGSEYRASEISSALVCAQLEKVNKLQSIRKKIYFKYLNFFNKIKCNNLRIISINKYLENSYHLFLLIFNEEKQAEIFKKKMRLKKVAEAFHYIPLHSSTYGRFVTKYKVLPVTESIFLKVVRLPLHSNLKNKDIKIIFGALEEIFNYK